MKFSIIKEYSNITLVYQKLKNLENSIETTAYYKLTISTKQKASTMSNA